MALALSQGAPLPISAQIISELESKLIGDWTYLGTIKMSDQSSNFTGSGRKLVISNDRKFVEELSQGEWEADSAVMNVNGLRIPYLLTNDKLILSLNINAEQWMLVYQR